LYVLDLQKDPKKKAQGYNFQRTKTFFIIGTFYVAPILHVSYSKILPRLVPETTAIGAVKKLALDQLVAAPLILLFFFPVINVVEGRTIQHGIDDLKSKYLATMVANYKIWPAANLVNFMFVPIQYQVLFANAVSLIFNAVLSYMHNTYKGET
jgi:hypothetical protein